MTQLVKYRPRGPDSILRMHLKRLTVVAWICNLRAEEAETGRLLARQPSLGSELQAAERLCLKNKRAGWVMPEKQHSGLVSGLHMYMNMHTCATYKYMYYLHMQSSALLYVVAHLALRG